MLRRSIRSKFAGAHWQLAFDVQRCRDPSLVSLPKDRHHAVCHCICSNLQHFCPLFRHSSRPQILCGMTTWPLEHDGQDPVFSFPIHLVAVSFCLFSLVFPLFPRRSFSSLGHPDREPTEPLYSQLFPNSSAAGRYLEEGIRLLQGAIWSYDIDGPYGRGRCPFSSC